MTAADLLLWIAAAAAVITAVATTTIAYLGRRTMLLTGPALDLQVAPSKGGAVHIVATLIAADKERFCILGFRVARYSGARLAAVEDASDGGGGVSLAPGSERLHSLSLEPASRAEVFLFPSGAAASTRLITLIAHKSSLTRRSKIAMNIRLKP